MSGLDPNDNPAYATPTETYSIRTTRREVPAHLRPAAVNRRARPSSLEPFSETDTEAVTQAFWSRRCEGLLLDSEEGNIQELSIEIETALPVPDAAVVGFAAVVLQDTETEAASSQDNVDQSKISSSEVISVNGSKIEDVESKTDRRG
jgi:hypothetical protein